MQQMIVLKITASREVINKRKRRPGAVHHGDGNRSVQRYNRRRLDTFESVVETDDLGPIRVFGARSLAMNGGNCGLKRKRTCATTKRLLDERQRFRDLFLVPTTPVLILE